MATKSIPHQVIDEFIGKLSTQKIMSEQTLQQLKDLLFSGQFKKDDISKLFQEDLENENSNA